MNKTISRRSRADAELLAEVKKKYYSIEKIERRRRMQQKWAILMVAASMLMLSGCSAADQALGKIVLNQSGIMESEDYQQYQQMSEQGELDGNGYYAGAELPDLRQESEDTQKGKIHVTFARNSYLSMTYYRDKELTQEINQGDCWLNPGDCVYGAAQVDNPNSNLYELSEFWITEYDEDGIAKQESKCPVAENHLVYQIPEEFAGSDLSIAPVGVYSDRNLTLNVFYLDRDGEKNAIFAGGTWEINGEECNDTTVTVSAVEPYILKFNFDRKNYFYVSSQPQCFTPHPNDTGFVEFTETEPTDENTEYSIELHKNICLELKSSEEAMIQLNGGEQEKVKKNSSWKQSELKYGDVIQVETKGNLPIPSGDIDNQTQVRDSILDGYRYIITIVPENEKVEKDQNNSRKGSYDGPVSVTLDPNCEHGECSYQLGWKTITGVNTIDQGKELTIKYTITDSDYQFADQQDGIAGFFGELHDKVANPNRTQTITIAADMDGTTIHADDYFSIIKKGE